MSGEIDIQSGYEFNEVDGEELTLEKLNRMISALTLQVRALSITSAELADNSVTADKLDADISGQLGLPDGSVTLGKLASDFLLPITKGGTGATTAASARTNLGVVSLAALANKVQAVKTDTQTETASIAWIDVDGLSVEITPTNATHKIFVRAIVNGAVDGSSPLYFRLLRDGVAIGIGDLAGSRERIGGSFGIISSNSEARPAVMEFMDSPGVDVAVTYKVQLRMFSASYNCYINRSISDVDNVNHARLVSVLTCEEVPVV